MASIDCYKHELLGFIFCESDYNFINGNKTRKIAIYRLLEDIPDDEDCFDGKVGDILLGGGSGESPALRISYPQTFKFYTNVDYDDFNEYDELAKTFWTPTQSFMLCNGFVKAGWNPEEEHIESWLTERIIDILTRNKLEYSEYKIKEISNTLEFENIDVS